MDAAVYLVKGNLRQFCDHIMENQDTDDALLSARTMLASWYGGHQSRMYRLAVAQVEEWISD